MSVEKTKEIRFSIFEKIGLKVDETDPIIQLYLLQEALLLEAVKQHQLNLTSLGDAMVSEIKQSHISLLTDFDLKKEELNVILTKLEEQKEAIIGDVWQKLDAKTSEKIHKQLHADMQDIANNANNKINNQRNILIGGIIGLLIGIVFCIILFMFK